MGGNGGVTVGTIPGVVCAAKLAPAAGRGKAMGSWVLEPQQTQKPGCIRRTERYAEPETSTSSPADSAASCTSCLIIQYFL